MRCLSLLLVVDVAAVIFINFSSDLLIVSTEWLPLRGDVCGFRIFCAFPAGLVLPGLCTFREHKIHIRGGFLCLTILLCFVTCKLRLISASEGTKIISLHILKESSTLRVGF